MKALLRRRLSAVAAGKWTAALRFAEAEPRAAEPACFSGLLDTATWCGEVDFAVLLDFARVNFFAGTLCAPTAPQHNTPASAVTNFQPGPIFFIQYFPSLDSMTRRV
jgi:hypothetical protein